MKLTSYILTRVLLAILMLFILLTTIFVVTRIIPGDPIRALYGPKLSDELANKIRHQLGLDKPLVVQYFDYLTDLFHGDLGTSYISGDPVLEEILHSLPVTLEFMILAIFLSATLGIVSGGISALHRGTSLDGAIRIVNLLGFSMPMFLLGLLLQLIFGRYLGVLPLSGRADPLMAPSRITGFYMLDSILTLNIQSLVNSLLHLILPSLGLSFYLSAVISRITRANMINVMDATFITVTKAKGLPKRVIVYKHMLRNSISPVLTITALLFATGLGGAILTEIIFGLPGMGKLLFSAIYSRDFPLISGCTTIYAIGVIVITTLVDIIHALIDPRVREEET